MLRTTVICLALLASWPAAAVEIVKQEPAKGGLRYGEVVFVDNGKCPKGQVQQVTGGQWGAAQARSTTVATIPRQYKCVPRPN
ncbi:MAG: hypothetical protein JNK46_10300 [Methylobacteriaceae bacterium]|nr:hypothetical protein [Methylobacteriaceae bacterium]